MALDVGQRLREDLLVARDPGVDAWFAVGDDRLQQEMTGRVRPESFTHGSSAQRTEWFKRGMSEGTIEACNTFQ